MIKLKIPNLKVRMSLHKNILNSLFPNPTRLLNDMSILVNDNRYVIEFKVDNFNSLNQIKENRYYEKFGKYFY